MAEPKTTKLRRPDRESGQALVEAVLLSLVIAMIACAALEFGTYFYAVDAADAATTEAAHRPFRRGPSGGLAEPGKIEEQEK